MKSIGIIGYGAFGTFVTDRLSSEFEVSVYDVNEDKVPERLRGSLRDVCKTDYIILAIPLSSYNKVLSEMSLLLAEKSVIVDISSVKVKPIELINNLLPGQPYIAIHPLFGPETVSDTLEDHTVVVCESKNADISHLINFFSTKRMKIVEMSADEHDREMAVVQGLTFFLARGLNEFGLHKMKLKTPSFLKLLSLAELDKRHSNDLLETILDGNEYTKQVRKEFMKDLENFNKSIG